MELESTISRLNRYRRSIDDHLLDDLIDFLLSQKIIDEETYYDIYDNKSKTVRLLNIFRIVDSKNNEIVEKVFQYFNSIFPNIEKRIQEEENFRISSVRGGFPKLPPNYVTRRTLLQKIGYLQQKLWEIFLQSQRTIQKSN